MIHCTICGDEVDLDEDLCPSCGTTLVHQGESDAPTGLHLEPGAGDRTIENSLDSDLPTGHFQRESVDPGEKMLNDEDEETLF